MRARAAANVFVEKDVTFCTAMLATYLTNVPTGNVVAGGSGGAVVDVDAFTTSVGRSDDADCAVVGIAVVPAAVDVDVGGGGVSEEEVVVATTDEASSVVAAVVGIISVDDTVVALPFPCCSVVAVNAVNVVALVIGGVNVVGTAIVASVVAVVVVSAEVVEAVGGSNGNDD